MAAVPTCPQGPWQPCWQQRQPGKYSVAYTMLAAVASLCTIEPHAPPHALHDDVYAEMVKRMVTASVVESPAYHTGCTLLPCDCRHGPVLSL